jgi:hypothetical protein
MQAERQVVRVKPTKASQDVAAGPNQQRSACCLAPGANRSLEDGERTGISTTETLEGWML